MYNSDLSGFSILFAFDLNTWQDVTALFQFVFAFVRGVNNENKADTDLIAITLHTSLLSALDNVLLF